MGVEGGPEVVFSTLPVRLCALFSSCTVSTGHDSLSVVLQQREMG